MARLAAAMAELAVDCCAYLGPEEEVVKVATDFWRECFSCLGF
jgi:hypothetical protein